MCGAWQRPPYTGRAIDLVSLKKSEIRKTRFSLPGGPLTVTDVRLRALMKILLAAGVLCYFESVIITCTSCSGPIHNAEWEDNETETVLPHWRGYHPTLSGPSRASHQEARKPRCPVGQSLPVPGAADSERRGRLQHQDERRCGQSRLLQLADPQCWVTARQRQWREGRCRAQSSSCQPSPHCIHQGYSRSSCRSPVSTNVSVDGSDELL